MNQKILVFLPTYNERENLPVTIERLLGLGLDVSILIVDDLSPDGTGAIADGWAAKNQNRIRVIHRQGARGRGKAGIMGLKEASKAECDLVVEMDADLSHDPLQLPTLLEAAKDADLVIGYHVTCKAGRRRISVFLRKLNSSVARFLSAAVLGLRYTDPTSGYRVYRREVLEPLPWDHMISDGPSIVEETLYHLKRNGAKIVEVPIEFLEREAGSSKITLGIILRWIVTLLKIRLSA